MATPQVQIDVALEVKAAREALDRLNKDFEDFANRAKKQSRKADVAFGAFVANIASNVTLRAFDAIKEGFREAFKRSLEFNKALKEIETILPKNTKLTQDLVDELSDLGKQFGTGATTQAKAFYQIISAGVTDAVEAQKALNAANLLASGGLSDLGSSIDVITDILNVYKDTNITAGDAADTLFKSVQLGKLTVDGISQSIAQALPSARALGIGLDEVASALVVLTKNGFQANEAAVRLRALFSAVAKDGQKLGDGLNSAAIEANGLSGFLTTLAQRTKGSADATANLFGNVRAQQAALILANDSAKDFTQTLGEYETKAGAAARASEKIVGEDLSKQLDIAKEGALSTARAFFDDLQPALLSITKALNQGISPAVNRTLPELQGELRKLNIELAFINDGSTKLAVGFKRSSEEIQKDIEAVSRKIFELEGGKVEFIPSESIVRAKELEAEIKKIETALLFGTATPIQDKIKLGELKEELKSVKEETADLFSAERLKATTGDVQNANAQLLESEAKFLIDIRKLREEAALAEEERRIREREAAGVQRDEDFIRLQEIEQEKLQLAANAALEKSDLIADSNKRDLEQQKISAKFELDQEKLLTKQKVAELKQRVDLEQKTQDARVDIIKASANLISAATKDGSKVAFLAQKGAALASAIVSKEKAAAQALAVPPAPNLALAGLARTAGNISIAAIAASAIKGFENGGFVGASLSTGDRNIIRVNNDEAVLNTRQQREFMRLANGSGGQGGGEMVEKIDELINAVNAQPVSIQVDGRELIRVMRNEQRAQGVA